MNDPMKRTQQDLEILSSMSLKDFCDGYRWMFEKNLQSIHVSSETIAMSDLQAQVGGIIAVNKITYAGEDCPPGMFEIILEKDAIFSLGGITIMKPLMQIKEECAQGSEESATKLADAICEVGNLLTGSFGKIFRAGCPDVEGYGDQLTMRLSLPVDLGTIEISNLQEIETVHVFTYRVELDGLTPFQLKIVFPAA